MLWIFLHIEEDATITSRVDFPFQLQVEVVKRTIRCNVATAFLLGIEVQRTINC